MLAVSGSQHPIQLLDGRRRSWEEPSFGHFIGCLVQHIHCTGAKNHGGAEEADPVEDSLEKQSVWFTLGTT